MNSTPADFQTPIAGGPSARKKSDDLTTATVPAGNQPARQ